jgi:hypothetical protein
MDLHFKFVREQYMHKEVAIRFVPTNVNLVDVWTKSTGTTCHVCMHWCGLQHSKPPTQL